MLHKLRNIALLYSSKSNRLVHLNSPTCGGERQDCSSPPCLNTGLARYPCWLEGTDMHSDGGDPGVETETRQQCHDHVAALRASDPAYRSLTWTQADLAGNSKVRSP